MRTLKWIYNLGKLHERRRVKLLIAEHRNNKPDETRPRELDLWYAVEVELNKLTNPNHLEMMQYEPPIARIDEEL